MVTRATRKDAKRSAALRGKAAAPHQDDSPIRPRRPLPTADVLRLQRTVGNQVTGRLLVAGQERLTVQRDPEPAPTAATIRDALDEVTLASGKTRESASLRPWAIFETLPWNPSDGKKKTLFAAARKAHAALGKANTALAEATRRAAAEATAKPKPKSKRSRKKGLTVAAAQAAVDRAQAAVTTRTQALKDYVKGKLNSSRNPRTTAVRAERATAITALRDVQAKLSRASRGRKPDATLVADLTRRRDLAKAEVAAAEARLGTQLGALRAEIDAADWGQQNVTQTVAVYEVDGARATLTNSVEAYATVTAEGFEGSATRTATGGPTVPELLAKDPTLGPSTRKILAIISRHEGDFTSVNTWDIADVTFGMVQWTTGASGHGDLVRALTIMKQATPDAFAARLGRYGIDVAPTGLVLTRPDGTVLTGVPAAKAVQSDAKLTAVLSTAGTDPALQAAELRAANEIEVQGALNARLTVLFPAATKGTKPATVRIPVSALITSELGVGVLANHTVHGGFPANDLQRAANAYTASHKVSAADVATWGPDSEAGLIAAISKGSDADRIAAMRRELDSAPGTFH